MPNVGLVYRLRVRTASTLAAPDGTADALVLTSVPSGTNPYLAGPPSGDGQELDLLRGTTRTGAYTLRAIDARTGSDATGTLRVLTAQLDDATGRPQLLSRRCYVEVSTNGGTSWATLTAGYLQGVRLVDALTYELTVGDSRRVERSARAFRGAPSGSGALRGALAGGPVIGGEWFALRDLGGWQAVVGYVGADLWRLDVTLAYTSPAGTSLLNLSESETLRRVREAAQPYYVPRDLPTYSTGRADERVTGDYPDLRVRLLVGATTYDCIPLAIDGTIVQPPSLAVRIPAGASDPAVGTPVRLHVYSVDPSPVAPVYYDLHPVDLACALWAEAGITYDATSAAAAKATLGSALRVAVRRTETAGLQEWLEGSVLGPFGLCARTNSAGQLQLLAARAIPTTTPTVTIGAADLRDAESVVYDLDESTAITAVEVAMATYAPGDTSALDGIAVGTRSLQLQSADVSTYGERTERYQVDGMVRLSGGVSADLDLAEALGRGVLQRYARGAPSAEVRLLRSWAGYGTVQVGDEVLLQVPHYPQRGYRVGESTVGARIMLVTRRTEEPEGCTLRLVDQGADAQPASPAPTITIAASTRSPRTVALATIGNAGTINSGGVLTVAVEMATGAGSPSSGATVARWRAPDVPTTAQELPPVAAGSTVWIRARAEQEGRRAGAWSAWASVTLTAIPAPSALAVSAAFAKAIRLSWTNGSATDDVVVFAAPLSSAPADWSPYRVARLRAGTTRTTLRELVGPSQAYRLAVAHVDSAGTLSTLATATSATGTAAETIPRPIGARALASQGLATGRVGVALALWGSDLTVPLEIQRATASTGPWATVRTVPGDTAVYVDELPDDGVARWYCVRHALTAGTTSDWVTLSTSATPGPVATDPERPALEDPVVAEAVSETATDATLTLTITDPCHRITSVEAWRRIGRGDWQERTVYAAGFTSYTHTVPLVEKTLSAIKWQVFGMSRDGVDATELAAGEVRAAPGATPFAPDAFATVAQDGTVTVRLVGDSDTSHFRCALSTTSAAAADTAAAAATATTSGQRAAVVTLSTLTLGQRGYITAYAYSSGGLQSQATRLEIVRGNVSASKTLRISATGFRPRNGNVELTTEDETLRTARVGGFFTALRDAQCQVTIPDGVTVTKLRARVYHVTPQTTPASTVDVSIGRVGDAATTWIANVASAAVGWQTIETSLSELTTGRRYALGVRYYNGTDTSNTGVAWVELDYDSPNLTATL